jgi:polyhydroxyalkanoate synthesis regulator phasin
MKDKLKKAMLIGLGVASVTKENAEKVAKDLMKKHKINEKEARKLVNKVAAEIDRNRIIVEKEIKEELGRLMKEGKKVQTKAKKRKR